jgi:hypothetical protein
VPGGAIELGWVQQNDVDLAAGYIITAMRAELEVVVTRATGWLVQ